jgi:hypothetical protein
MNRLNKIFQKNKYKIYSILLLLIILYFVKEYIFYRLELPFDYDFIK